MGEYRVTLHTEAEYVILAVADDRREALAEALALVRNGDPKPFLAGVTRWEIEEVTSGEDHSDS